MKKKRILFTSYALLVIVLGVVAFYMLKDSSQPEVQNKTTPLNEHALQQEALMYLRNHDYAAALDTFMKLDDHYKETGQQSTSEAADVENQIINLKSQIQLEEMKKRVQNSTS